MGFVNSLNYFRAIAILFIVSGHFVNVSGIKVDSFLELFAFNILGGGTNLFVFISGYLFHHVFYHRYNFKKFVKSKVKNVLAPYLVLSVFQIAFLIYQSGNFELHYIFKRYFEYLLFGNFITAYWYIPFAMVLFLLSPIYIAFVNLSPKIQWGIVITTFCVAVFAHRPIDNLNVFHSLIFFTPMYLLGMCCSIYKDKTMLIIKKIHFLLVMIVVLLCTLQSILGDAGSYHKSLFTFQGVDLMLLQKIALCLLLVSCLRRYENSNNSFFSLIAATSFAIYFIHPYILIVLWQIKNKLNIDFSYPWLVFPIVVIGVVITSMALATVIKKAMPKYSRMVCGY